MMTLLIEPRPVPLTVNEDGIVFVTGTRVPVDLLAGCGEMFKLAADENFNGRILGSSQSVVIEHNLVSSKRTIYQLEWMQ